MCWIFFGFTDRVLRTGLRLRVDDGCKMILGFTDLVLRTGLRPVLHHGRRRVARITDRVLRTGLRLHTKFVSHPRRNAVSGEVSMELCLICSFTQAKELCHDNLLE